MSKKRFSGTLIVSIALHAVLLFYIGNLVLDKVLPTGEVSTVQINYENPQGATKIDVVKQLPEKKPEPKPEVKVKPVKNLPKALPVKAENPPPIIEDQNSEVTTAEAPPQEVPPEAKPEPQAVTEPAVSPVPAPVVENTESTETTNTNAVVETAPPSGAVQSDAVLSPMAGNKKINYPYWARLRQQEGLTVVNYTVTADGNVEKVDVVKSSGYPFLDREVVNTIKGWKFKPMGRSGIYERPVQFSLKGDAQAAPSTLRTTH